MAAIDCNCNCLARAVYDNFAETCDELPFRKNDILTVLDQTPGGLYGWWLCELRGKQGIAPSNRLRLIPNNAHNQTITNKSLSSLTIADNANNVSVGSRRRSWHINSNRVEIPQKIGDIYLYVVPQPLPQPINAVNHASVPEYDFPVGSTQSLNIGANRKRLESDTYDTPPTPRAINTNAQTRAFQWRSASAELLNTASHLSDPQFRTNSIVISPQLSSSSSSIVSPLSNRSSLDAASLSALSGCSNRSSIEMPTSDLYDIRPQSKNCEERGNSDSLLQAIPPPPPTLSSNMRVLQFYDIPTNNSLVANDDMIDSYDIPRLNKNNGSFDVVDSYDIPRLKKNSSVDDIDSYDIPRIGDKLESKPIVSNDIKEKLYSDTENIGKIKHLEKCPEIKTVIYSPIEAQKLLLSYQIELESLISKLFSFVTGTNWRSRDNLKARVDQLNAVCHSLCSALKKFIMFGYGALTNANYSSDKSLSLKLCKLLNQLGDSNSIIENSTKIIDDKRGWSLEALAIKDDELNNSRATPDHLDQLIACARGVIEDVKHTSTFIRGNAKLIFSQTEYISKNKINGSNNNNNNNNNKENTVSDAKPLEQQLIKTGVQSRPLPPLPPLPSVPKTENDVQNNNNNNDNNNSDVYDVMNNDYDYVCLESKEVVDKQNRELKSALPQELHKSYDCLVKTIDIPVDNQTHSDNELSGDYRVLHFYGEQMDKHKTYLSQSIDAFIHVINNNQPPKIFMNHSKFVVIAGQKLIYIGDTVTRNVSHNQIRANVSKCANKLCDSLKVLVINTKKAAINFPSVTAVQEMVDSVVDVSFCANQLFIAISKSVKSI